MFMVRWVFVAIQGTTVSPSMARQPVGSHTDYARHWPRDRSDASDTVSKTLLTSIAERAAQPTENEFHTRRWVGSAGVPPEPVRQFTRPRRAGSEEHPCLCNLPRNDMRSNTGYFPDQRRWTRKVRFARQPMVNCIGSSHKHYPNGRSRMAELLALLSTRRFTGGNPRTQSTGASVSGHRRCPLVIGMGTDRPRVGPRRRSHKTRRPIPVHRLNAQPPFL